MELEWIARLVVAGILGALVGFEREKRAKEAGFRTHFLVAIGSALIMIVSKYGFFDVLQDDTVVLDPSRVAAQIVSGIGFLGAGTILVLRGSVKGLTTAAGLWAVSGIGMTIGAGMYIVGICGTALVLLGLEVLNRMFKSIFPKFHKLSIQVKSNDAIPNVIDTLTEQQFFVTNYQVRVKAEVYTVQFQLKTDRTVEDNQILKAIQGLPDIESVKFD